MSYAAFVTYVLIASLSLAAFALAAVAARHVCRRNGPGMVVLLAFGAVLGHYLTGEEKITAQKVIFYRHDPDFAYLVDRGSEVLADEVHIVAQIRGLPDDAHIQLLYTPIAETNWVLRSDETVADWRQFYNPDLQVYLRSFDYFGAVSNRWCIFTPYIRPSQVLTNGVLHVLGVQCDAGEDAVAGVPLHTGVSVDGEEVDLMTRFDSRAIKKEEDEQ